MDRCTISYDYWLAPERTETTIKGNEKMKFNNPWMLLEKAEFIRSDCKRFEVRFKSSDMHACNRFMAAHNNTSIIATNNENVNYIVNNEAI